MKSINVNYIHHISQDQYEEALVYVQNGTLPHNKTRAAFSRFICRWRDATVQNVNDEPKLFIDHKEVIPESRIEQVLSEQYDNPLTGGNYGRDKFYERIRTQYVGISRSDVDKFIQNDETHQLHRPITKKLQVTRPLSVPDGPFIHWQMDLIELSSTLVHVHLTTLDISMC